MKLAEIHVIQTVAPSNLNRDDTGSPKDAIFGGVRRARLSSQSQKRAVREYFRDHLVGRLFELDDLAIRTKRILDRLVQLLPSRSEHQVRAVAETALRQLGLGFTEGRTEYLLFLGEREMANLATLIDENWDLLAKDTAGRSGHGNTARTEKQQKKRAKAELAPELAEALRGIFSGGRAVDLALFGRMVADDPRWGVDAAAQVAHAISTHRVDREFDFYTAVDDLNPREETGAGMMGDVEFASATFYRYANVNLGKLLENLGGDKDLTARAAAGFLHAFVQTLPSGKQNSFAAHNPPKFVAFIVSPLGMPRNLAGAFEKPVRASGEKSLAGLSVESLLEHWKALDDAYGRCDGEHVAILNISDAEMRYHADAEVPSLTAALQRMQEVITGFLG